jgi:MFS family permease
MGGLLLGPAVGAIGAALGGGYVFPFVFCSVAVLGAAVLLAATTFRRPVPQYVAEARIGHEPAQEAHATIWNRLVLAAIVINVGSYFASGTYEVIWSLWMTDLGASLGLVGLTFAAFGLAVLLFSPVAGGWSDRRGPLLFIVLGSLGAALAGVLYALLEDPILVVPVVFFEGISFALLGPALYAVVARGTPAGRSATTQGVFGAAGTLGTIVASIVAGILYSADMHLPFYAFTVTMLVTLGLGLVVGGRELWHLQPIPAPGAPRVPSPKPHRAREAA